MAIKKESTEVLVVGGGPTGLFASILLSQQGISHILIESRTGPQPAPAAHVVNTRTMEIFRQAGLNMPALYALNRHQDADSISWVNNLQSPALGKFGSLIEQQEKVQAAFSQDSITNISQTLLEEALLGKAREQADAADTIRYGVTWENFYNDQTQISIVRSSDGEDYLIEADYVLAADGAGSPIARALGITKQGPKSIATYLNLSCRVDMTRVAKEKHSLLYWVLDPEDPAVCIVHDPRELTVVMRPVHLPYEAEEDFDDARCHRLLKKMFGDTVPFEVIFKGFWNMSAQIADAFRYNNVILIGDSAHRFPPTGGLGLNSGIADAHNVVWKIVAHKKGADDALLDSYEQERRAVVQTNCDRSVKNHFKMDEVFLAIGLDPTKAEILPRLMSWPVVKWLPTGVQNALKNLLLMPARKLLVSAADPGKNGVAKRVRIQAAIDEQSDHFHMPGTELGYVYREGIAVSAAAKNTPGNDAADYLPTAAPGARLPHVWLDVEGQQRSLFDLLDYAAYTLLSRGEPPALGEVSFGLPVTSVDITKELSGNENSVAQALSMQPGDWILVRPDGHIADRSPES